MQTIRIHKKSAMVHRNDSRAQSGLDSGCHLLGRPVSWRLWQRRSPSLGTCGRRVALWAAPGAVLVLRHEKAGLVMSRRLVRLPDSIYVCFKCVCVCVCVYLFASRCLSISAPSSDRTRAFLNSGQYRASFFHTDFGSLGLTRTHDQRPLCGFSHLIFCQSWVESSIFSPFSTWVLWRYRFPAGVTQQPTYGQVSHRCRPHVLRVLRRDLLCRHALTGIKLEYGTRQKAMVAWS